MQDKYKEDILKVISEKGALGVNAISRELNIPVSTLQKYLHKQNYFKLNEDKKWDLPERVASDIKSNTLELMTTIVESNILLLKTQLDEMALTLENSLTPISTLKRGIAAQIIAPVAKSDNNGTIDSRLQKLNDNTQTLQQVMKKQKHNIPDDYANVLFNFDYIGLVMKEGKEYTDTFIQGEIYELLAGKLQELSEEAIEILKENQFTTES